MFTIEKGVSVHWKGSSCPRKRYDTTAADTVESSSGIIEFIEMLNRRISKVKSTPASGALKMPAIAPAAPHPIRMVIPRWDIPAIRAKLEPMAAPV